MENMTRRDMAAISICGAHNSRLCDDTDSTDVDDDDDDDTAIARLSESLMRQTHPRRTTTASTLLFFMCQPRA